MRARRPLLSDLTGTAVPTSELAGVPDGITECYFRRMNGTYNLTVGDRGRLVIPAELRHRRGWTVGASLVAIETELGVILTARSELERIVRSQLVGTDVVRDLIDERRRAALVEDAG